MYVKDHPSQHICAAPRSSRMEIGMVEKSIWSMSAWTKRRNPLPGDIRTETVIIGAGMAGILTAHFLEQAGMKCVVLDAGRIGGGETRNTTAKVTSAHSLIYARLLSGLGQERALEYARANQEAVERYKLLSQKYGHTFEWKECSSYLYTLQDEKKLREEYEAARRLRLPAELTEKTDLPFSVKGALEFHDQGQIHPLKFLYTLAEDLTIYENTKAERVESHRVVTSLGTVYAENVVFACHYPFTNSPGYYFMRMHQERSYVLAVKPDYSLEGIYYGIDEEGLSFRSQGKYVLVGGGGHRTGKKEPACMCDYLSHRAQELWPGCKEVSCWAAQDCMTLDGIPYIGPFSKSRPGWYVATGFGKWGMTSSMVSAMILSNLICRRKNPYAQVFSPQRFHLTASMGRLCKDGAYAASGLLKQAASIPKEKLESIGLGHGGIVEYNGHKYGVYKEVSGQIYAISTKCPHLGCQLAWNQEERSWDCPCHGSRFDYKGKRLNEPAQADLECHMRRDLEGKGIKSE